MGDAKDDITSMGDVGDDTTLKRKRGQSPDSDSSSCWQLEVNDMSLADKWNHMFENQLYTDTRLLVGENLDAVECHRIVLILNSPVFESMLSPRWSTNTTPLATADAKEELYLPMDDPCSIKLLISRFYNGNPITEDEALDLLLVSKKYICPHVTNKCLQLLKSSTNEKNFIPIFQTAFLADEPELLKQAEKSILAIAFYLIRLEEFRKLKHEHLKYFLGQNELNVDEVDLFNEVYKWGQLECERQNLDSTKPEIIYEVLKDILPLIRFNCMDLKDFSVYVVSKNVLPLEQAVDVYKFLTTTPKLNKKAEEPGDLMEEANTKEESEQKLDLQLNMIKARSRKLISYIFKRLKDYSFYSQYKYDFGKRWNNFCFQADQDIKLVSLGFFRSIRPDPKIFVSVRILDEDMNEIFSEFQETTSCSQDLDVFHLSFPKPVRISKKVFYTISYMIQGQETIFDRRNPTPWNCDEFSCFSDLKINFSFKAAKENTDMDQVPELGFQL